MKTSTGRVGDGWRVENCTSHGNSGRGIATGNGCVMNNCLAYGNGGVGILTALNCALTNCTASGNLGIGIEAQTGTLVNCVGSKNGSVGTPTEVGIHVVEAGEMPASESRQGTGLRSSTVIRHRIVATGYRRLTNVTSLATRAHRTDSEVTALASIRLTLRM